MVFTTHEFLFLFLPLAFGLFWFGGRSLRWRLGFLTFASYVFYSWWQFSSWDDFVGSLMVWKPGGVRGFLYHWRFTLVMLASSSVDYFAAMAIARLRPEPRPSVETPPAAGDTHLDYAPPERADHPAARAALLALSLIANVGLLSFFKYAGFFSHIANDISHFLHGGPVPIVAVVLPVGISFYTFESMSYVIDVYRGLAKPAKGYLDYACFISFFPHLVAGPIIRWSDILHQFRDVNWVRRGPDWEQVQRGLLLLTMGMAKKLFFADKFFSAQITPLWDLLHEGRHLGFTAAWGAVLGYTFQIYFDFSGYSDMAGGIGHLFAVRLPQNFDSPYKATNPSDFWRRWHITLSTWLRDYLFIPLGGSRVRTLKTVRNLFVTFLIGGLWHGAAWLFVLWGAWHGMLLAVWHLMRRFELTVSTAHPVGLWANRLATFFLVVIGWAFFRAADVNTKTYGWASIKPAADILKSMWGGYGFTVHKAGAPPALGWMILFAWVWCNFVPNSYQLVYRHRLRLGYAILAGAVMAACVANLGMKIDFLYFRF